MIQTYIRWMIRRDMPEVLKIENHSFEYPWNEEDFIRCLRQRNCIGMVAEYNELIMGYMIYELHKDRLCLINMAVHENWRKQGVGQALIDKLYGKLSFQRRDRIILEIRETNLAAQLFFKQVGFKAIEILAKAYDETDEDAYLMVRRYRPESQAVLS